MNVIALIETKRITDLSTRALSVTHQRGLTQQFASSDQVADGDVEVGVPTAPVGDLGKGVSGEDVLHKHRGVSLRSSDPRCIVSECGVKGELKENPSTGCRRVVYRVHKSN